MEVCCDLKFIEKYRAELLNYDEQAGRKILREQNAKADKADGQLVAKVSKQIAEHLATKKEHEQLIAMRRDLSIYISLI